MSIRKKIRNVTVTVEEELQETSFQLEYYLLERETEVDGVEANTFGIEVLKRSHPEKTLLHVEYRKIFDVFCTEAETLAVIEILANNTVTPISVYDVLEQFIGADDIACEEYQILAV